MAQFRRWKQRFRAYHNSSNLQVLTLNDQQAFLVACVDDHIADRLTKTASETRAIFPNEVDHSCYNILEQLFQERIPLLLRKQQFLSYTQSEGQSGLKFRKELRNLADEANITEMMPEDMLGASCSPQWLFTSCHDRGSNPRPSNRRQRLRPFSHSDLHV